MQLIKDLNDIEIIFYWTDDSGQMLSPALHSLPLAEEWYKNFLFSTYEGKERRHSIIDRRSNEERRTKMDRNQRFGRRNPTGRRASDKPISVTLDLTKEKLKLLYC